MIDSFIYFLIYAFIYLLIYFFLYLFLSLFIYLFIYFIYLSFHASKDFSFLFSFPTFAAILYIWMWSEIRSVWNIYILPDWLNIFGSFLYWISSASQHSYSSNSYLVMRRIELFASCVELLAVAGWAMQWYWEYYMDLTNIPLSCVGRGFTLDDPGRAFLNFLEHVLFLSLPRRYNVASFFTQVPSPVIFSSL